MTTIPDGFAQCSIPFAPNFGTTLAFITFGVQNNAVLTDPTDVGEVVWTAFADNCLSRIDEDVLCGPVHVQLNAGAGLVSGDGTSSGPGTSALTSPPPQCALLVQKRTGLGGRGNRGRLYLPYAVDQTGVTPAGQIDPSVVAATTTAFQGFRDDLESTDEPMVILHAAAGTPALVTTMVCESVIATQRRRVHRS